MWRRRISIFPILLRSTFVLPPANQSIGRFDNRTQSSDISASHAIYFAEAVPCCHARRAGVAGLTLRTRFWVESIFTGTVLLFLVTGLLAFGRSGRARVSSLAFALFGGGYLLLVMCSVFSPIRDLLLTDPHWF